MDLEADEGWGLNSRSIWPSALIGELDFSVSVAVAVLVFGVGGGLRLFYGCGDAVWYCQGRFDSKILSTNSWSVVFFI